MVFPDISVPTTLTAAVKTPEILPKNGKRKAKSFAKISNEIDKFKLIEISVSV